MNENIYNYVREKNLTPESLSIINIIVQFGQGMPARYLTDESIGLQDAETEGYVHVEDEKLFLTKKAQKFLETLFQLAKLEGELQ